MIYGGSNIIPELTEFLSMIFVISFCFSTSLCGIEKFEALKEAARIDGCITPAAAAAVATLAAAIEIWKKANYYNNQNWFMANEIIICKSI